MSGLLSSACIGVVAIVLGQFSGCFSAFNFNPPTTPDPPNTNTNSSNTVTNANSSGGNSNGGGQPTPAPPQPEFPCSTDIANSVALTSDVTVTGTIDEVWNITTQQDDGATSTHTESHTRIHAEFDLRTRPDNPFQFEGEVRVTWSADYVHTYSSQFPTEGCPNPIVTTHTYPDRHWTVILAAGSLECVQVGGQTVLKLVGDGTPDGRGVPVAYTVSPNCGQSFERSETPVSDMELWSTFAESGVDAAVARGEAGQLNVRRQLPLPFDIAMGEHYRDVRLRFNQ